MGAFVEGLKGILKKNLAGKHWVEWAGGGIRIPCRGRGGIGTWMRRTSGSGQSGGANRTRRILFTIPTRPLEGGRGLDDTVFGRERLRGGRGALRRGTFGATGRFGIRFWGDVFGALV